MRHDDHDVVARFSGPEERRQLFARDLRGAQDAELVFIPEDGAEGVREACRAGYLVCPVADCPDPRYIAKGGSRRHHFAHHGGAGGHAPESFYHQVGKQLLAAHIRKRQPQAEVAVEGHVENGQVADVLVRSPLSGRRYAFELQYSPLTVEAWRARHEGYRALGIIDCWVFGHTPPHLRAAAGAGLGFVALTPLAMELFHQGLPVIFLNPDEQAVATALLQCHLHQLRRGGQLREGLPQETSERAAVLSVDPLSFCEPYARGLLTPTGDRLRRALANQPDWAKNVERHLDAALAAMPDSMVDLGKYIAEQEAASAARERKREAEEARQRRARVAELKVQMEAEDPDAAARWRTLQRALRRK